MSNYEKLTKKADGLTVAAAECKTPEGRKMLSKFAGAILTVRDSMTTEEAVKE